MLALLIELLLQILWEAFLQLLAEMLFEFGFQALAHSLRRGGSANRVLAGVGFVIIGAVLGLAMCWFLPEPLFRPVRHLPGLSLVLAPVASGAVMQAYGSWRRRAGDDPSLLATFWGGALFAFAMGLSRALCLGRA